MNKKYKIATIYGLAHGINDFIAGYLLSALSVYAAGNQYNSIAFLMYSIIAFGGQLPAGIVVDKQHQVKRYSIVALICMIAAVSIAKLHIFSAILLSGIGSAFIHVCGGAICYTADNKNSTLLGIFTSPGVIGLILGGILGANPNPYFYYVAIPILFLIVLIYRMDDSPKTESVSNNKDYTPEIHDYLMMLLLLAISFRSLIWNILHMLSIGKNDWLIAMAFSAAAGKLIGGILSNQTQPRIFILITTTVAAVLLNLGKDVLVIFCLGIAMLQSAVPVTLLWMQNYMRRHPATATGLSLGVAIILAGLPTYLQEFRMLQYSKVAFLIFSMFFLISNVWYLAKMKNR